MRKFLFSSLEYFRVLQNQTNHSNLKNLHFTEFEYGIRIDIGVELRGIGASKHQASILKNPTFIKRFDKFYDSHKGVNSALGSSVEYYRNPYTFAHYFLPSWTAEGRPLIWNLWIAAISSLHKLDKFNG